jgi:biotin operon repressor
MALDRGLSALAFRLATVLLHYEGERGCFPSQERLGDDLGISIDSVQRYLRELELYGFLIVDKRGRRNNYRLKPIYEPPIPNGSIVRSGQLEVENAPKETPPAPRTLRGRQRSHSLAEKEVRRQTAPVRRIKPPHPPHQRTAAAQGSEAHGEVRHTAPVRPIQTAPVRLMADETPHRCGTTKNHTSKKNQHHQPVGGVEYLSKEDDPQTGIVALQRVGVNVVLADLGIHAGRARRLRERELFQWAEWVQSSERNGIFNKAGFAASKIRVGCALGEAFPEVVERETRKLEAQRMSALQAEAELRAERELCERSRLADDQIASLNANDRRELRERALKHSAVWLTSNLSPDLFERFVRGAERRLVLEAQPEGSSGGGRDDQPVPFAPYLLQGLPNVKRRTPR